MGQRIIKVPHRLPRARSTGTEIVPGRLRLRRHGDGARGPALPGGPLLFGGDCYYSATCGHARPFPACFLLDYTPAALDGGFWFRKSRSVLNSA